MNHDMEAMNRAQTNTIYGGGRQLDGGLLNLSLEPGVILASFPNPGHDHQHYHGLDRKTGDEGGESARKTEMLDSLPGG